MDSTGERFINRLKKMRKSQLAFFHELKKCFCHLVLQMKQCFGRTSFDVFTKGLASSRTMFRRRWSFLVTKRLLKDEKGLFFVTMSLFFWKTFPSHLQLILSTEHKKIVFTTQCCFEKRTWKWHWKKTKSFTAKSRRILEDFSWTLRLHWGKRRNFESFIFSLVWWNEIGRNTFPIDRH